MYYSIPNWSTSVVTPIEKPWEVTSRIPATVTDKEAWRQFCRNPATKHCFFSALEGMTADVRVSDDKFTDNPPYRIHAFVADFDAKHSDEAIKKALDNPPCDFMPNWHVRTFSGGSRLIWEFDQPLPVLTKPQHKKFLGDTARRLRLEKWLEGWDSTAWNSANLYYEIGQKWTRVSDVKFPSAHARLWVTESCLSVDLDPKGYELPMEELAAAVEAKFPGRWKGEFRVGARGIRFWDPSADNDTAAIVTPKGMLYFTRGGGFKPWQSIFGEKFSSQFEAARFADAIRDIYCVDHVFYQFNKVLGSWVALNDTEFTRHLRSKGISSKTKSATGQSDVDTVKTMLAAENPVMGARPFVFQPKGLIMFEGKRQLNTYDLSAFPAAPPGVMPHDKLLTDGCPTIWAFLSEFFAPVSGKGVDNVQLWHFLAWLKHAYESAVYEQQELGQAIVIAGAVSGGKTFLAYHIVSQLLGGEPSAFGDGKSFIMDGSQWNDHLFSKPVILIDDVAGAEAQEQRERFSSMIKPLIASPMVQVNRKFASSGKTLWPGRLIIACNDDPRSLRLLPDLEGSFADKVNLYLTNAKSKFRFSPDRKANAATFRSELAFFGRWLLDWEIPDAFLNKEHPRYRIFSYKHPDLFREAFDAGASASFFEILQMWIAEYTGSAKDKVSHIELSAAEIHRSMSQAMPQMVKYSSPRSVAHSLAALKKAGVPIEQIRDGYGTKWKIPVTMSLDSRKLDSMSFDPGRAIDKKVDEPMEFVIK